MAAADPLARPPASLTTGQVFVDRDCPAPGVPGGPGPGPACQCLRLRLAAVPAALLKISRNGILIQQPEIGSRILKSKILLPKLLLFVVHHGDY